MSKEEELTDTQIEQLERARDIEARRQADKEQLWRAKMIEERQKARSREGRDPKTGRVIDNEAVDVLRLSKVGNETKQTSTTTEIPDVPINTVSPALEDMYNKLKEDYKQLELKYKIVRGAFLNFASPHLNAIQQTYSLFLLLQDLNKEAQSEK